MNFAERECDNLVGQLLGLAGWTLAPQVEENSVMSALVHSAGARTTVITLPASRAASTVVRLVGGPAPGSWLRSPAAQWRREVPMPVALHWVREYPDDPSDAAALAAWAQQEPPAAPGIP